MRNSFKTGIFGVLLMIGGLTIAFIAGEQDRTGIVNNTPYLLALSFFIIIFGISQFVQAIRELNKLNK